LALRDRMPGVIYYWCLGNERRDISDLSCSTSVISSFRYSGFLPTPESLTASLNQRSSCGVTQRKLRFAPLVRCFARAQTIERGGGRISAERTRAQGTLVEDGGVSAGAGGTAWFSSSADEDRNRVATAFCESILIGAPGFALFPLGFLSLPVAVTNDRAALFALLRACLAFLLASLKALRACLYLSFANRAVLRASSASISAVTARAIQRCGSPSLSVLLNEIAFIVRFSAVAMDD